MSPAAANGQARTPPDPWVEALRIALVPIERNVPPVAEDQRGQALSAAERAARDLGTGIDPAPLLVGLERFGAALRVDPACVPAYLGIGRVVQRLASRRPKVAEQLYTLTIDWLQLATTRIGSVQASGDVHVLDMRLRELRNELRARPRPDADVEPDVVRLSRDREGRANLTREEPRFSPPSAVMQALARARHPTGTPRDHLRAGGVVLGVALLVFSLIGVVVGGGQDATTMPEWSDADLDARVQEAYAKVRPLLTVGAATTSSEPTRPAVVATDVAGRALPDALGAALPLEATGAGPELGSLVIVRRYTGARGHLALVWVVDLRPAPHVVTFASVEEPTPEALEARAAAWLGSLTWR